MKYDTNGLENTVKREYIWASWVISMRDFKNSAKIIYCILQINILISCWALYKFPKNYVSISHMSNRWKWQQSHIHTHTYAHTHIKYTHMSAKFLLKFLYSVIHSTIQQILFKFLLPAQHCASHNRHSKQRDPKFAPRGVYTVVYLNKWIEHHVMAGDRGSTWVVCDCIGSPCPTTYFTKKIPWTQTFQCSGFSR